MATLKDRYELLARAAAVLFFFVIVALNIAAVSIARIIRAVASTTDGNRHQ